MRKDNGRPDYYISPSHDFTQYTKDHEEKHWDRERAFDWSQNVQCNLQRHLENLDQKKFSRIVLMTLPILSEAVERKIKLIQDHHLPSDENALVDISESIPGVDTVINQAIAIQGPLRKVRLSILSVTDQLEIINSEILDVQQQQRLGFYRNGRAVKLLETEAERNDLLSQLSALQGRSTEAQNKLTQLRLQSAAESESIKPKIQEELNAIEGHVLHELDQTKMLLQKLLQNEGKTESGEDHQRLKSLMLKRQLRALKDIANHALVVEQSAIAPLTMGIIHYKRHREIQEAMTTFVSDEAKHSATFRRFLVEKLQAKEYVSEILIKGANRYMWIARIMPGAGIFLAVIVEAIGAAYLEFFGNEEYMPETLFCSISKTIADQDETRHMDLCAGIYNELYKTGSRWEHYRNSLALRMMMKAVYGDKNDDHHLIQAFRVFGVQSDVLYGHIMSRLSQQLSRISMYITPELLLKLAGRR